MPKEPSRAGGYTQDEWSTRWIKATVFRMGRRSTGTGAHSSTPRTAGTVRNLCESLVWAWKVLVARRDHGSDIWASSFVPYRPTAYFSGFMKKRAHS